jgi:hypothetical protein
LAPKIRQVEIDMDEMMRPRDIQARIRAGASVDDVIVESGLDRERVERFAAPMLAEREHIIYLALDTELRRDFANDISLVAAVSERLTPLGVERSSVNWQAWRREDGRWIVEANFVIGREQRSGHWAFDPKTSSLIADDAEAHWLIDPDASEPDSGDRGRPLLATVRPINSRAETREPEAAPAQLIDDTEPEPALKGEPTPAVSSLALAETPSQGVPESVEEQLELVDAPAPSPPAAPKRKGRASVPSWDDIVFGAKKPTE